MKVELRVQGMTCEHCAQRVEKALRAVDGVKAVGVDYKAGHGTVDVEGPIPSDALTAAVRTAGYDAQVVEAPSAAMRPGTSDIARRHGKRAGHHGNGATDFDLVVIGTGGAGVAAAIQAATMHARVGIAEGGLLGGTCVNVGCIPSKNLIEVAGHYHAARKGFPGIGACSPELNWSAILNQKNALVRQLQEAKYADVLASYPSIKRLEGRARILTGGQIRVGDVEYRARKVIIASGTSPAMPPIPGLASAKPLDSTTVMDLEPLPESMIVLGGSAVGLELGQTFARFGVKVTVVELLPRLLPSEDEAISEALERYLREEGLEIHTGVATTRVERDESGVTLHVREGSLEGQFHASEILVAAGRRPNTRDLGLESIGVEVTEKGFVRVDSYMRTTNPDVFAAGDVTGGPGFVYVAAAGGRVAAENAISREQRELDLSVVPNVTFTSPQVASVGLTENAARAAGHHVEVSALAMEHVPRALVSHDTRGLVKIVAEAGTGRVLGVHAVAPNAGELMGEATLAVRLKLSTRDLTGTLHPYLTWIESLRLAAQGFGSDVTKLSCCA